MAFGKAMEMMGKKPKMADEPEEKGKVAGEEPSEHEGGKSFTVHDHGDGTSHTEHEDGNKVEHPTLGHQLMHHAAHQMPEGKHMHAHSDGFSHTSHHVSEGGEPEGPQEHGSVEEMMDHGKSVMGEEQMPSAEEQGASLSGYGD